jgi:hypothetical protein
LSKRKPALKYYRRIKMTRILHKNIITVILFVMTGGSTNSQNLDHLESLVTCDNAVRLLELVRL